MRRLLLLVFLLSSTVFAQNKKAIKEIKEHQKELNTQFKTEGESPLTEKDRKRFKALDFFEIDLNYCVDATFIRTQDEVSFKMKTSTDRLPEYVKYGELHFKLHNQDLKLNVYQNVKLVEKAKYKDYLFIPFTDLTNGETTYGGGRYIDFKKPTQNNVVLDFNKSYNPYCAYSGRYSCPIPPIANHLLVEVNAGVKKFNKH